MAQLEKPRIRVPAGSRRVGRPNGAFQESMAVSGPVIHSLRPGTTQNGAFFLPTDDIITRKGWKVYREMKHDDQVKACLAFKKVLISGRSFDIEPAKKGDAEAERIAKFVEWALGRVNIKNIFKEALTSLDFGFSIGEIIWSPETWDGSLVYALGNIKHRDPQDIEIEADRHGNVLNFKQTNQWWGRGGEVILPREKIWHLTYQSEFGNLYGVSDLRAAYRAWWAKKFLINFWNVYLERMGSPMTMMKYPMGASEQLKATLKSILGGLSSRSEVLVPEGVEIDLIEATRAGTATYEQAIEYQDRAIARGLLMTALLGMGGDNITRGADSQARLQLRVLFKMADEIGRQLVWTFMEQVIKPMVDMNFDHKDLYPKFIWQDYGEFEGMEVADTIRLLFAAGILDLDQADVNYARSVLGLPLRGEGDKEDETIRPQALPPPASANAPPPAANQGNQRASKGASGKPPTK